MRRLPLFLLSILAALVGSTGAASAAGTVEVFGQMTKQVQQMGIDSTGTFYTRNQDSTFSKVTSAKVVTDVWATVANAKYEMALTSAGRVYTYVNLNNTNPETPRISRLDSTGAVDATYTIPELAEGMVAAVNGDIWFNYTSGSGVHVGLLSGSAANGTTPPVSAAATTTSSPAFGCVAADANGDAWAVLSNSGTAVDVRKYDRAGFAGGATPSVTTTYSANRTGYGNCNMAADADYVYIGSGMSSMRIDRVKISDNTLTENWVSGQSIAGAKFGGTAGVGTTLTIGSDGSLYVLFASGPSGPGGVYKITRDGTVSTLATMSFNPGNIAVDAAGAVYVQNAYATGLSTPAGIYKVVEGGSGGGGGGGSTVQPTAGASFSGAEVVGCTLTLKPPVFAEPTAGEPEIVWSRYDGSPGPTTPKTTIESAANSLAYALTAADADKYIEAIYTVPLTTGTGFSGLASGRIAASGSCGGAASPTTAAPGPTVKTNVVPKEITIEIPSTPGAALIANVPCEAAGGERLKSCTVDMKAPMAALLGQGDGVIVQQARASKTFVAGKATMTAKRGAKRIVVPVRINAKGRTALSRNIRLKVTVGITTVTLTDQSSSGSADTEMQLPKQVLSPQGGIFDTLSTRLNADGRSFVNRLAALLPDAPKAITCTGYADSTGVPGDNRWLGDRRAKALCAALEAKGIEAKTVRTVSKGATSPRDDNGTAEGRERNRRATVTITY